MRCFACTLVGFLCWFRCACAQGDTKDILHRSPRQLLYPNSTLLQFNAGVGTPTPIKEININWAFQANFQLPWNRSQIPVDILWANSGYEGDSRKQRSQNEEQNEIRDENYENDARLYHFYKYVEDVLNGFGHNGSCCVRRALCQLAAQPLHPQGDDDLLHELASFVLNPTHDVTEDSPLNVIEESSEYLEAYRRGQNASDCHDICERCSLSLVDMFSNWDRKGSKKRTGSRFKSTVRPKLALKLRPESKTTYVETGLGIRSRTVIEMKREKTWHQEEDRVRIR
ncbi:hypothetical protein EVAR_91385_1 [Eumeta japonica]|uniref:Uncharacterized protein n=1 Tax=Eumeta variegata TaxID=151549 RepID=A0A4C1XB94_EUMVA|nr:hypothetical protein EVAR_91385_1 [Eumeta japonica]